MKKIVKVWILWLAFASSLVALLVSATWEFKSQVTLTLTEWKSTCILDDYIFSAIQASPVDQNTESLWQIINCRFLENGQQIVTLHMSDLTGVSSISIPASWFSWQITSWNTIWSIPELENVSIPTLNNQPMIYQKWEYTVGEWSGTLTLQWVIPWWTPGWTYNGTIDLTIQPPMASGSSVWN